MVLTRYYINATYKSCLSATNDEIKAVREKILAFGAFENGACGRYREGNPGVSRL